MNVLTKQQLRDRITKLERENRALRLAATALMNQQVAWHGESDEVLTHQEGFSGTYRVRLVRSRQPLTVGNSSPLVISSAELIP